MSLFSRKATPASAVNSSTERSMDVPAQSPEFLAEVGLRHEDGAQPLTAIAKLHDVFVLQKLAGWTAPTAATPLTQAAERRLGELFDQGATTFQALIEQSPDAPTLLARLIVEGTTTRIRQLAAESITDPDQLRELLKDVRGKDKNVYKIIRQKCDALLALEKQDAERRAQIETLLTALDKHSHLPFDAIFIATLEHFASQWTALKEFATSEMQQRMETAIDRCRQTITRHVQEVASQAAHQAAIEQAGSSRGTLLDELRALLAGIYDGSNTASSLAAVEARWLELADYKRPNKADNEQYSALLQAVREGEQLLRQHGPLLQQLSALNSAADEGLLGKLNQTLRFAHLLSEPPAVVSEAQSLIRAHNQAHQEQEAAHAHAIKQLSGLMRAALGALANGQSRQAAGMRRAIEDKLPTVASLPAHLTKQLEQLDEKLKQLQDWRSYAVAPKRVELIEQMEALLDAKLNPNELAEKIKRLQDEWKLISKGNTDDTDAEWQRFHAAAQAAFVPCKEHFEKQAKLRADNLDKRKALLQRLATFAKEHNWEQPNWREVGKAVFESKQMWRRYQPVERGAAKSLQKEFDAVLADLEARLGTEYARNTTEKRRLMARAQGLLHIEDLRKATDEAKRLQSAWKEIGVVAHDDEQTLWNEFREHCNAVFAKKHSQANEHHAALDANKSQIVTLCDEAEQIAKLSGDELLAAAKTTAELRERFAAIGELPRAQARDLQNRFENALNKVQQAVNRQRARAQAQAWDRVLEIAGLLHRYRTATLAGASADDCAAQKQAIVEQLSNTKALPKPAITVVKSELEKAPSKDLTANAKALHIVCIRAEILTDTPTPADDHSLRREYQLQQLTQRGTAAPANIEASILEWLTVGPTEQSVYESALHRLNACRKAAL